MSEIDSMKFWMDQLSNRSYETVRGYKRYFLEFCHWLGKSPDELILIKKQGLEHDGDRRENMVLEGKVKQFISQMEHAVTKQGKQGYGLGTRQMAYAGISSFFALNEYPLSMKRSDRPSGDKIGSRIPEKAELVKLVNRAKSRRTRAVILFLKDSGLRISDVVRLKWTDIQDMGDGFYGFTLITQKSKVKASPFIGPEASEALDQLPRKNDRIFQVEPRYLSMAITILVKEAELADGLTAHGLRKYFNTELEAARVPKEYRYAMMGKKVSVYDENRQGRLFNVYKQNYDHLRIFGIVRQDEEIAQLKEVIDEQRMELAKLNRHRAERIERLDKVDKEMVELKRKLDAFLLQNQMRWQKLERE